MWLPAVAVLSAVVVVFYFLWPTPPPIATWRPQPLLTQPDQPAQLNNPPPANPITGEFQAGAQFDISVGEGLYSDQRPALNSDLERALAYVSKRFGSAPAGRFSAAVERDDSCGLHGVAYTDVRTVHVYTCNNIGRARAVAIMAHEFVHQLEQDRYGPPHLSADLMLSEGLATWGAGIYWLGGQPDFRAYVRAQQASGVSYPLATNYSGLGVAAMNALYYQWASFVDFLISTYGRDKFDRVYVTGHSAVGSADYAGVYGKPLSELEKEWQSWLDR